MNISLSDHFDSKKILKFTLSPIIMMVFTSIYGVVDGFFISNFVGKTAFAAVNFVMPLVMILGCFGFMFGTGGSALISKTLGEGKKEKANKLFSMLIICSVICGFLITLLGFLIIKKVLQLLGAQDKMLEDCLSYARIVLPAIPVLFLQYEFQSLFVAAEKPKLGLYVTVAAGVTNMVLDALFVGVFNWGIEGAALATAFSQFIRGVFPIIYFSRKNTSLLRLTKPEFDIKALFKICSNGSSEVMSNISMSLVGMLYNFQLLKYAGENGVAVYGVLMYVNMIFLAVFIGFSIGTSPLISYHFGAQNFDELKGILKRSLRIIFVFAICMFILSQILAKPLAQFFVGYDNELKNMTLHAFFIFAFCFLLAGFSIFGSSFFTALNDGLVSALISFLRTLVFQVAAILILPLFWQIDGIWISSVVAEVASVTITFLFLIAKRNKYKY